MLTRQARTLTRTQIEAVRSYLRGRRNGLRNETIFLLSFRSGLRAMEIANLQWSWVVDADGEVGDYLRILDTGAKGSRGGREIPIHRDLRGCLESLLKKRRASPSFDIETEFVVRTERSPRTSPQVIANFFQRLYRDLGLVGCSSHSGRRTFITECARQISRAGGSLRDIQYLAGHSSLQTTQRYIESSSEAKSRVIGLI